MLDAIDNYAYLEELTSDIVNNPALLNGMHLDTLAQLTSYAVEKDDFRVLALLTEIYTGIPANHDSMPSWWLSNFYDDVSEIKFAHQEKIKKIRWCDITLSDGEPLTSNKHQPLLNAFKYWLIACDNPLSNGGRLKAPSVAAKKFNRILTLINVILLNGEALKLPECHLEKVTDEFWLKVLLVIAESGESTIHDLYQTNSRIEILLNSADVSEDELEAFIKEYPYAGRNIYSESALLGLDDRVKACCWLYKQGYYSEGDTGIKGRPCKQGHGKTLIRLLFAGKILIEGISMQHFPELALCPTPMRTEYRAVPNHEKGKGVSVGALKHWLSAIKSINTNIDKKDIGHFNPVTDKVSIATIQGLVRLRRPGRTKTLPPEFVLDLFRDSYELLKQFCPSPNEKRKSFWENTLDLLVEASKQSTKHRCKPNRLKHHPKSLGEALHRDIPSSELGYWLKFGAKDLIHTDFKAQGVTQFEFIFTSDKNRHDRIRDNESMLELFTVLQGAIQLLLGTIMARRQDELVKLKPYGNLVYIHDNGNLSTEANPYIKEGERWFLRFKVKKTGIKGNNLSEDRPIPLSIARFVWQLEQFNQQIIEKGLAKKNDITLFNSIHSLSLEINKGGAGSYNAALDGLCDYFETTIVQMDNGEYLRHYVRQHQLRRFFALVFFWSKRYENMEALRWMLAHSDLEHLHNYITDNIDGSIINSVKASTIVQSVINDQSLIYNLDELEKLRKIIAKRLTGSSSSALSIATLEEAIFDYEDVLEYRTSPHISQLQAEHEMENEVLTLLENGSITLQPEFFTVKDEHGEKHQNFNLILKVNEVECG
ncbi:integrase [Vibrio owensii]|uniref:integrase n=1 Tax=Vibrio owensii TaxID=696485 RepID=UPI003AAE2F2F